MIVYHEVAPEDVQEILQNGIRCGAEGEKTDASIAQADKYLDKYIPENLAAAHVSRRNNIYAYLVEGESIVDITNGQRLTQAAFLARSEQQVVTLDIDPDRSYVSDVDAFDTLKQGLEEERDAAELRRLASQYWARLLPLSQYDSGSRKRPEVMITYDVPPVAVSALTGYPYDM